MKDREAWSAAIHGVAKSWARLSNGTELNWNHYMFVAAHLVIVRKVHNFFFPPQQISPSRECPFALSPLFWLPFQFNLSCVPLCDPMDSSTPGFSVHHQLPELTHTHVHWVSDAIQPSYPLSSPSLPAFNLSQHQGLFQWVSSLHQVAKVLEFQLQHQSFQWIFRTDWISWESNGPSIIFSNTTVQKHQFFSTQPS